MRRKIGSADTANCGRWAVGSAAVLALSPQNGGLTLSFTRFWGHRLQPRPARNCGVVTSSTLCHCRPGKGWQRSVYKYVPTSELHLYPSPVDDKQIHQVQI